MIDFKPYKIIINGNKRDDLLYELYLLEKEVKRRADEEYGTAATKYESKYPAPVGKSVEEYNKIERKPSYGPEAKAYETTVCQTLKSILQNRVGRLIVGETNSLPEKLFILPIGARDRVFHPNGHTAQCDGDLDMISATSKEKVPAIKYTPRDAATCQLSTLFGPETSLFHEFVHAIRPHKMTLLNRTTGDKWDNLEEFFAVVTENVFRSERNKNDALRGGHDESVLHRDYATSEGFLKFKRYKKWTEFVYKHEKIARKLGEMKDIVFNPFALVAGKGKP